MVTVSSRILVANGCASMTAALVVLVINFSVCSWLLFALGCSLVVLGACSMFKSVRVRAAEQNKRERKRSKQILPE